MSPYLLKAKQLRETIEPHYNCAQCVLLSFSDALNADRDTCTRLASNFASGMKFGATCGAVAGSIMVLGLADLNEPEIIERLLDEIRQKHQNHTNCKDLLATMEEIGETKSTYCTRLILECTELVGNILNEYHKI